MREKLFFNALRILLKDSFQKLYSLKIENISFEEIWKNIDFFKQNLKINTEIQKTDIDPEKEYDLLEKHAIKIVLKTDAIYPSLLKEIYRPPLGLYVKGNIDALNQKTNLAIIGSRKPTNYGKLACEKIIKGLAGYDINIIGGLALGIDSYAHYLSLKNNLNTLAFIGSGFNYFYPSTNKNLAEKIIENGGAVITEYPINTSPEKYYFVARNRLISGVSKAILIIEAQEKSGTIVTARFAEEQNRDILAVPNNIFESNSRGTNKMIKEGAALVQSAEDVLEELGLNKKDNFSETTRNETLSLNQKNILKLFEKNIEIDVDIICEKLNLNVPEIMAELTILELGGIIKQTKSDRYMKIS